MRNGDCMKEIEILNDIYAQIHEEKNALLRFLSEEGYPLTIGFFPFHSFKRENEFYLEQYPIPVITVDGSLDVGIDIHQIFFEFKLDRETAIEFDYNALEMYTFEVYGIEDYYDDFYLNEDIESITHNIELSMETEVGVSILISKDNYLETTKEIMVLLESILDYVK